jgi:hypothetical protein
MRRASECVEDALRRVEDCAAFLRYAADSAALNPQSPTRFALSGMADACADVERTIRAIRKSLDVDALGIEVTKTVEDE